MHRLRQIMDLVQNSQVASRLSVVDNVIEPCREHRDVFSIERGDEAGIQGSHNVVGRLVPHMLRFS